MGSTFFRSISIFALSYSAWAAPRAVFMNEHGNSKQIEALNLQTGQRELLTSGDAWHLYPAISPDGAWLAYVEGSDEAHLGLMLKNLNTNEVRALTAPQGMTLHPDFSGDGRKLAVSAPIEGKSNQIALYDLKTLQSECVTCGQNSGEGAAYFPTLSSDGSTLVFQRSQAGGKKEIWKLDLFSKEAKRIATPSDVAMAPALSFDDHLVAYTARVGEQWDIYVTNLLTGAITQVTRSPARDYAPAFAPNGDLLLASDRGGSFQLYRYAAGDLGAETDRATLLLEGEGTLYAPDVSGDTRVKQAQFPDIPAPARSSFGALTYDNKVFVVGGHQGREHTYPPESFVDRAEYYDLSTGQWVQIASRATAAQGFALAGWGRHIYAFGGFAYSAAHKPGWKSLDVIERYDLDRNVWEVVGRLPRARSSYVAAQVGSKVYLIGGWDATPRKPNDLEGVFHAAIDVVDLETLQVSTLAYELPKLRRAFTGVVKGEKVYLLGGISPGASHFDLLADVTELDTANGAFRELTPLPFATFAPAAGLVDNRLHVFGGMFKVGAMDYVYVNHVYAADNEANNWAHTGRYLNESKGFSAVVDLPGGAVGLLGGHTYQGDFDTPVAGFESFRY